MCIRKLLRKLYCGLGLGAVALVFQACYGGPMREQNNTIEGKVCRKTTNAGIDGIQVKADGYSVSYTYDGGIFTLAVPVQESYHIEFEDVDDELNGGKFKKQEIDTAGTAFLIINMELE